MIGVACLAFGSCLLLSVVRPSAAAPIETRAATETDATPRLVIEAGGHQAIIRTLLFTANGQELVSVSDDKTIRVWAVVARWPAGHPRPHPAGAERAGPGRHARRRRPLPA